MTKRRGQRDLDEGPSQDDIDRFDDVTTTCKNCGTQLYDDVDVCWNCGHALAGSDHTSMPPKWVMLTSALLLALFLLYLLTK
jgi:uncharacterized paraquat-inducible protein A